MNGIRRPDGIEHRHIHEARGTRLHAWPSGLVLFGVLIVLAALGILGDREIIATRGEGARLSIEGPSRIRSGEYFEMLFTIEAEREIRDAVLAVGQDVWHDVTINTMIPQPTEEDFEEGSFRFHFGALPPGSRLVVKVDGQINPRYPPGTNRGEIAVVDGASTLTRVAYSMEVLP